MLWDQCILSLVNNKKLAALWDLFPFLVFLYVVNMTVNLVLLQTVVLKVGMSCQGCVGAVKRVLGKMEG